MASRSPHDADDVAARLREVQEAVERQGRADGIAALPMSDAVDRWATQVDEAASLADPLAFEVRRAGLAARLERTAKRMRGRAAAWTTWPQSKFNQATVEALRDTGDVLRAEERWIAELHAAHRAELDHLHEVQQSLRAELEQMRTLHALALEEHRVVMRQLALEVSEAAQLADRTRRRVEHQLDGGGAEDPSIRSA